MKIPYADDARLQLLPLVDKVAKFKAKLSEISTDDFKATTYLLTDIICEEYKIIIDHCWVNDGVQIRKQKLKIGDIIEFESKVHIYLKNGFGIHRRADLTLSTPRNIKTTLNEN